MRIRRCFWAIGGGVSLLLGSAIISIAFTRVAERGVFDEPMHFLAAIPPFILPVMEDLPDPVVIEIFLVWWMVLGAEIGWLIARDRRGAALAVAVVLLVAGGHVATKRTVEGRIDFAKHEESEYSYLIRWLVE